jgi:RHS repeat-associated protein
MKKFIIIILTIFMLGLAAISAQAASGEIAVTAVTGSANTADAGPVQYLNDGNPGTAWRSAGETSGPLWAELRLGQTVIVDGLQIYGQFQGDLTVEYWQDNGWHPFMAARNIPGTSMSYGWNLIDLSYDRIAAAKIRISLSAAQAAQLGGIGELKVLGRTAADLLQKLEPVSVGNSSRSQYEYPAGYLFDHNTYTDWRVYAGYPAEAESVADLGENCAIERIKVYTSPNGNNNPYQGRLLVQYQQNGNWYDLPGVSIDLNRMNTGWQSFDLSGNHISASKLRVVLSGQQIMGGIKEVEIWGYRSAVTGSSYLYSGGAPVELGAANSANYSFDLSDITNGQYTLHVNGTPTSGAPDLTWELNGRSMGKLTPASVKEGTVFYHTPIDALQLQPGINFVRVGGASLTVTDCRIEETAAYSRESTLTPLTDRWLLTPAGGNDYIIDLGGSRHLDQLVLQYLGNQPIVRIAIGQDGQWSALSGLSRSEADALGGRLIYDNLGTAGQIRISYDAASTPTGPSEIFLYGSAINEGAPKIKITAPLDGDIFTLSQWGAGAFCAALDNPDVQLQINGQAIYFTGTAIKLPLPQLGNPQGEQVIEAVVTDSRGRSGSDKIIISVSTPPDFTVNLPEGILYTSEARITISGQVIIPSSRITINGTAVPVQNNKFSTSYPLQEGLNLLTIKLVPSAGSTQVNTLQRKVVRTAAAPYLKVRYPADGQVVKDKQLIVSGEAGSLGPVKVTVNGKAATVSGGGFYSSPITLVEGSNKLTVIATGQNGRTTQAVLTVRCDNAAPALSGIIPAEGAYLNSLTISVSGTINDASPVSVLVNGVAATVSTTDQPSVQKFSVSIAVHEGANALEIIATDSAGNATPVTRNVFIDTHPPQAFTPTANPGGWTNNNKPVITFGTSDGESGVDHYEIGLDGGKTSGPVTSPHKFVTAIPDGEHTVQVKAVDKAGNSTIGEVKVYIDTAAPAVPAGFEVIPGIGRVILHWTDDDDQVVGYRITRAPAFSGGGYKELFREHDLDEIARYSDTNVTPGVNYTYTVQAIDRAGNYSAVTARLSAAVGSTTQTVDKEGGIAKFDHCTLALPKGAIADSGRILMQQTGESLPENSYGTKLGPAYRFALLDSSGAEINTKFEKPATLTISYADMEMPAGFDKGDLGVYWYNRAGGYWEKIDYGFNDIYDRTITVKLAHFSDYQVMASKYNSPSLDSYYELGMTPQSYFQDNVESVTPSGGSLTVSATDLKLPGRNGFDLVIKRLYDSASADQERLMASNSDQSYSTKAPVDTFGCGWSLAIPWIESSAKGKFIRLPDGQTFKIEWDSSGTFEYHAGAHFILKNTAGGGYSLTLNSGIKCEFDSLGRVITQTDPGGKNVITFYYNPGNGRQIATITDSIGRVVTFHYRPIGGKSVIDYITTGAKKIRTVKYGYNNGDDALTDVYDPLERHTVYAYESRVLQAGSRTRMSGLSGDDDNKIFSYTVALLNKITYPTGEKSEYTYDIQSKHHSEEIEKKLIFKISTAHITYEGTKIFVTRHQLAGKETNYSYEMNHESGYFKTNNFVPAYTYMYSCRTTEAGRISQIKFQQIENNRLMDVPLNVDNYQGPLMVENQISIESNQVVERVAYQYDIPLRAVTNQAHYRGGSLAFTIVFRYDKWGNPTYQFDSSRTLQQEWSYKQDNPSIKNLVATEKQTNFNPVHNTTAVITKNYTYDAGGRPLTIEVNDGVNKLITNIAYDDYGNVKSKTDESNRSFRTEFVYDSTYHAFPAQKVLTDVLDADGQKSDIVTYCSYDGETGMKISETDARGYTARYEYDLLNRLRKVTLPDDDTDGRNNPYREFTYNDQGNSCTYRNEKGQITTYKFDQLYRLTEVIRETALFEGGVKSSYHYNSLGQIDRVTDARGNVTSYLYDAFNRLIQVTHPGGAYVALRYNDADNSITITDENGGTVLEQKDWANRLIAARQNCSFEGTTEVYNWQFIYDSLGNKLRQIDPKSSQSDQIFDALGRLTEILMPSVPVILPGESAATNYRPTVKYEYNLAGFKTGELSANENAKGSQNKTRYEYDQLGRVIKATTQAKDVFTGQMAVMETKTYYDEAGNKQRVIDPYGRTIEYTYSARGYLLTETDSATGNITRYQYDALGNKTAVTDPRGNGADGSFTTWYQYDDMNRLSKTILPDNTPDNLNDNPYTLITYDEAGNKLTERDPNGVVTSYTYTARNWVETVSLNGELKAKYIYDAKGNQIEIRDALGNVTRKDYDSLGRLRRLTQKGTSPITELYTYDELGNRTVVVNGRDKISRSTYNGLGWLTSVRDPLLNVTQYFYDPNGNQVKVITANNLTAENRYDELNRLVESIDPLKHSTKYSYDLAGNRKQILDRRGTTWTYQYYPNYLVKRLELRGADGTGYDAEYTYDAVGNRQEVRDSANIIRYNYEDGLYQADPLNRLNSVERSFDGAAYRTDYRYDKAGLLTGIRYPEAKDWLKYNYNEWNQLQEVVGFTATNGMTYDANGSLSSMTYANGATASYSYDTNHRVKDYQVTLAGSNILEQHFTYDGCNNITAINEGSATKTFVYDDNNQLLKSVTPGKFQESDPTPGNYGIKIGDYLGAKFMDFTPTLTAMMGMDYNSSSIGIDFGSVAPGVKKIQVIPDGSYMAHRVTERTLDLYISGDNSTYTVIPRSNWSFEKDKQGVITITLKERMATRYLKVHVKFDERDAGFTAKNKATFLNDFAKMLRVYQEATTRTEEFRYDSAGNRTYQQVTLIQSTSYSSTYYANSDRLKTDGKFAFAYDEAGNLVKKGNKFTISGDRVTFTQTAGEGVEYWQYTYDLLNQLVSVTKNGAVVSEYAYNPEGLRVVKRAKGETTHYVFEGTEPLLEKKISSGKVKSYVYALGKYLARVDGVIGDSTAKVYYYHTDHLGSIRAVTDQNGKVVYNSDYLPFGTRFTKDSDFDELHGFTGKEYDPDIGLYYFNARWMDPELGRFLSEDPAADSNNPNLYSYCGNNPVLYTDPTGMVFGWDDAIYLIIAAVIGGISAEQNGGDFWAGAWVGAVSWGVGYGFGQALTGTALANSLGPVWTQALTTGLASGTMTALMGGNFGEGFVSGSVSGGLTAWLSIIIPEVDYKNKTDNIFFNTIRNCFISALSGVAIEQKVSGSQLIGATISSIYGSTLVFESKDADYAKELKAMGIEIKGDEAHIEKTQTTENGEVTTKYEIYVSSDLNATSVSLDDSLLKGKIDSTSTGNSLSAETNSSIIRMSVSVKSTGALTVDVHLGFENKYLTTPYGKLNEEFSGKKSIDTTPGIGSIPRMWRRYQWDTIVTKGKAFLDIGIIYRPTDDTYTSGNWATTAEMYVKINFSQYLK